MAKERWAPKPGSRLERVLNRLLFRAKPADDYYEVNARLIYKVVMYVSGVALGLALVLSIPLWTIDVVYLLRGEKRLTSRDIYVAKQAELAEPWGKNNRFFARDLAIAIPVHKMGYVNELQLLGTVTDNVSYGGATEDSRAIYVLSEVNGTPSRSIITAIQKTNQDKYAVIFDASYRSLHAVGEGVLAVLETTGNSTQITIFNLSKDTEIIPIPGSSAREPLNMAVEAGTKNAVYAKGNSLYRMNLETKEETLIKTFDGTYVDFVGIKDGTYCVLDAGVLSIYDEKDDKVTPLSFHANALSQMPDVTSEGHWFIGSDKKIARITENGYEKSLECTAYNRSTHRSLYITADGTLLIDDRGNIIRRDSQGMVSVYIIDAYLLIQRNDDEHSWVIHKMDTWGDYTFGPFSG